MAMDFFNNANILSSHAKFENFLIINFANFVEVGDFPIGLYYGW